MRTSPYILKVILLQSWVSDRRISWKQIWPSLRRKNSVAFFKIIEKRFSAPTPLKEADAKNQIANN